MRKHTGDFQNRGSPIFLITSMIKDGIGQHEVLLPVNHSFFGIKTLDSPRVFGSSEEKKNLSAGARWRVLFNYLGMSRTQLLANQIREFCYGYYYDYVRPTTDFSSFFLSETVCRFRVDDDFQGLSPPCE